MQDSRIPRIDTHERGLDCQTRQGRAVARGKSDQVMRLPVILLTFHCLVFDNAQGDKVSRLTFDRRTETLSLA